MTKHSPNMDTTLENILQKVLLLCEQNAEFADALKERLGIARQQSTPPLPTTISDERVGKIEQYLGLDYRLDTIATTDTIYQQLDYSFIQSTAVKDMLVSDFREMMRYRYGTRSHKADFTEFCKYAHYQLEELVNYFMEAWSLNEHDEVDIAIAKQNIEDNWPEKWSKPIFRKEVNAIVDIDYYHKATAVLTYLGISNNVVSNQYETSYSTETIYIPFFLNDVVSYIRRTRTALNHRESKKCQDINQLIEQFKRQHKVATNKYGKTQYQFTTPNDKNIKYFIWLNYSPWDDVMHAIISIVNAIKKELE